MYQISPLQGVFTELLHSIGIKGVQVFGLIPWNECGANEIESNKSNGLNVQVEEIYDLDPSSLERLKYAIYCTLRGRRGISTAFLMVFAAGPCLV